MKLISREEIIEIISKDRPEIFYIPEGRVLSPAAKDYLNEQCIRFDGSGRRALNNKNEQSSRYLYHNYTSRGGSSAPGGNHGDLSHTKGDSSVCASGMRCYGFHRSGGNIAVPSAAAPQKPEEMTSISGDRLVFKDDPVIQYRGKLDSAQAQTVFVQSLIAQNGGSKALISDLDSLLETMRELMRAEVTGEAVRQVNILGLDSAALRAQSHEPEKYYGVKNMQFPSYDMGLSYSGLNLLRTSVREAEVLAVRAFKNGAGVSRVDIIETLNRLSSACHILMCRVLAGYYK